MASRPTLLFLSQCLPYPPHSGVTNRTYHILLELIREFDVTLLAFSRRNHQATDIARRESQRALASEGVRVLPPIPIPSESGGLAKMWVHLRSLMTRVPYTRYEYESDTAAGYLTKVLESPPALVHADSLDLYGWFDRFKGIPLACTHHSIESELLRLRARHVRPRLLSPYLDQQASLLEAVERRICPLVSLNVMMSPVDAQRLASLAPGSRMTVAPNGVDTDAFRPSGAIVPEPGRLVFLGPTYMYPNKDGLEFFLRDVWPIVRAGNPTASLHLIGKNRPSERTAYASCAGVTPLGFVPDFRRPMSEAACSIVPLRIGGGTRLKILDAWALGKAVVSTSVGCEGLETTDGENILIRDDPESFAAAVLQVLQDSALRRRLEFAGRATVERFYSWRRIGHRLCADYQNLLKPG